MRRAWWWFQDLCADPETRPLLVLMFVFIVLASIAINL